MGAEASHVVGKWLIRVPTRYINEPTAGQQWNEVLTMMEIAFPVPMVDKAQRRSGREKIRLMQ